MKKNNKYIKIFALTLFFMISISFNVNVKALTDDNGNEIKCILENTGFENIANRDFCLTFNTEIKGNKYALLEQTSYNKSSINYYLPNFKKVILDISELKLGYKYMVFIISKYNYSDGWTRLIGNLRIRKGKTDKIGYTIEFKDSHNGNQVGEDIQPGQDFVYAYPLPWIYYTDTLLIDNNGEWVRYTEQIDNNINSDSKLNTININKLLYTDYEVKDTNGNIVQEPTEQKRNITYTYKKVKNNELYDIEFSVKGLKKGDKIFLGNYDSDNEKYLQEFNIISNTENPNARFIFNDIAKNARIDILIKDEKDNILISESINIDIDIFEDLKKGNINDFFNYVKNFINNKINKPIKNIMNSFQLLFNRLDVDLQIGIVIIFLIMIIFGIFRFLMKG